MCNMNSCLKATTVQYEWFKATTVQYGWFKTSTVQYGWFNKLLAECLVPRYWWAKYFEVWVCLAWLGTGGRS